MSNLDIYNEVRKVPNEAQKKIKGGRLSGMTDINPLWRIKKLTELFGLCGFGWKYEIIDKRLEEGGNEEISAFLDINLYVKVDGEWSDPIQGTGGSSFVANEKRGLYTSDECFKMALTDAISVACKSLGFGADIYWDADKTKYDSQKKSIDKATYSKIAKYAKENETAKRMALKAIKSQGYSSSKDLNKLDKDTGEQLLQRIIAVAETGASEEEPASE